MSTTNAHTSISSGVSSNSTVQVLVSFKKAVIDRFQIMADGKVCNYSEYLKIPKDAPTRQGDEANAVDQQFARYVLEWLGYSPVDWIYNQPQAGKKVNRPDYTVKGSIGTAFIVEDKNSTLDFDEEHLKQMRRYCMGTAGYAVWCNMQRLFAIRFLPSNPLKYEILVDIAVEDLFGIQPLLSIEQKSQEANLALFHLLFSKERFTRFSELVQKIGVEEQIFDSAATPLDTSQAVQNFIDGSRQSLNHLRLAALSQIQEAVTRRDRVVKEEEILRREWEGARDDFTKRIAYAVIADPVREAIEQLTPRLGDIESPEIRQVIDVIKEASGRAKIPATLLPLFENWLERALRINSALISLRFESSTPFRIAEAYQVWGERQSDQEDIQPEVFAEQVAYVFFVRLLLVRVLEDKHILQPRLASDGGFLDWSRYVSKHFKELEGISILNENFCDILSRKASHYYLHFFQQTIFDWFNPDDFLLVETLEFLCRYNFNNITSDIIGFTYEAYIDRHARDRKGHFLTRQEVVEYMLDLLEYTGPQIIGRRILDPASGSGSFLVHADRRYRQALVTFFCTTHNLADAEALQTHPTLYQEFARRYLDDLSTNFFGMELNPFACYLAEMNLLIQGLDELFVLQQTEDVQPVERFQIYNTDSLHLPREILDSVDLTGEVDRITVPDRLSDRLADEAYPIKAKLQHYAEGFFYLISNPPYVSSKQEELNAGWFRNTSFYNSALSGDMNLYLLFLRLGLYYLADYGHMIYIVPLTIFGDKSASAIRKLLKSPPFSPSAVVRFYRGDILFPGVDQAVGIVRLQRSVPNTSIVVSGGNTIQEAKAVQFRVPLAHVIEAVPQNHIWQGNWLVAQSQEIWNVWRHVRQVSDTLSMQLGTLLDGAFDRKQGDVNATYLNPLRLGTGNGSFSRGDIAIYKGEDIRAFAPLPASPSDWARPLQQGDAKQLSRDTLRASLTLEQLKRIAGKECGIVLREVARLNTRERLIATWFERRSNEPRAFTHKLWRMLLKEGVTEAYAKALLAIMNSNVTAYLINLFSTNNDVSKDDLSRVPIPEAQTLPVTQLAALADELLRERANLEQNFVVLYRAKLPEFDDGNIYLPPSAVIAVTQVPKLQILALIGRGEVKNNGTANGRIKSLRARNQVVCTIDTDNPNAAPFAQILDLFLREPERENETWSQAQSWLLPDTVAATAWLQRYHALSLQAQTSWNRCVSFQQQIDGVVADWYGFGPSERQAINEGLPWARRRRSNNPQSGGQGEPR
ncbi:MAG: N-6 DNA methylase [Ktedonobacteraceae bacterium]